MEEFKQELRNLVSKNRIKQVLKKLNELPETDKGSQGDTIIMVQQQFAAYNRDSTMGILDMATANQTKNVIVSRLLSIIDGLGEEVIPEPAPSPTPPTPTPQPAPSQQKKILFLASNPINTGQLRLGEEHREVEQSLRESSAREKFELTERFAVKSFSLFTALLDEKPQIVHFSGHGERTKVKESTEADEPADEPAGEGNRSMVFFMPKNASDTAGYSGGIVVEDDEGRARIIDAEVLAEFFGEISGIECVVLNACYSEAQAAAILKKVPYVIGMNTAVPDKTAINFAKAFYRALGNGREYENAFRLAKISVNMSGVSGGGIPVIQINESLVQG